jgi:hypothetical protein
MRERRPLYFAVIAMINLGFLGPFDCFWVEDERVGPRLLFCFPETVQAKNACYHRNSQNHQQCNQNDIGLPILQFIYVNTVHQCLLTGHRVYTDHLPIAALREALLPVGDCSRDLLALVEEKRGRGGLGESEGAI